MDIAVQVTLPDDLTDLDGQAVSREVLEQVVAEGYKNGSLGPKQVRILLGFSSRIETEDFLHQRRALEYTVDDLRDDMETMKRLGFI